MSQAIGHQLRYNFCQALPECTLEPLLETFCVYEGCAMDITRVLTWCDLV